MIQLFSREEFINLLTQRRREMGKEIEKIKLNPEQLLTLDINDVAQKLDLIYSPSIPILKDSETTCDLELTQINMRQQKRIASLDNQEPIYFPGKKATYFLPFEGDKDFFNYSTSNFNPHNFPPKIFAVLSDNEIQLVYQDTTATKEDFDCLFIEDLQTINNHLQLLEKEILQFTFFNEAKISLEAIKTKYLNETKGVTKLTGIPLRKKQNVQAQSANINSSDLTHNSNMVNNMQKKEDTYYKLRILHLSDLHLRGDREQEQASRYSVCIGNEWQNNIDDILSKVDHIDLVCFTGDLADWGREQEYINSSRFDATKFVTNLMQKLNLPLDRFFVVPGNHDISRNISKGDWQTIRNNIHRVDKLAFSKWIKGIDSAPLGFDNINLNNLFDRKTGYHNWLTFIGREALLPSNSPHGKLGFRNTLKLPHLPFNIHIIGLDSAWLCGDDSDSEKISPTSHQIDALSTNPDGSHLDGFRIALIHHPLSYFYDQRDCSNKLSKYIDLLLRGHVHEETFQTITDPDRALQILAAGSLYEGYAGSHWPNSLHLIQATLDSSGKPISYDIFFRSWSKNGFWHDDSSIYKAAKNGKLHIDIVNPK